MHCAKLYPGQTCFPVLCSRWPLLPDTFASRAPPVSAYNGSHFLRDKGYFNQISAAIFTCMYTVYLQTHPSFCRFVKMAHPSHRGSTSFVSSSVSNIAWHYHMSLGLKISMRAPHPWGGVWRTPHTVPHQAPAWPLWKHEQSVGLSPASRGEKQAIIFIT